MLIYWSQPQADFCCTWNVVRNYDSHCGNTHALIQQSGTILLTDTQYVVIDEADTLFDDGFLPELEKIILPLQERETRSKQQESSGKALFIIASATFTTRLMPNLAKYFPARFALSSISSVLTHVTQDAKQVVMPSVHKSPGKIKHNFVVVKGDKHGAYSPSPSTNT